MAEKNPANQPDEVEVAQPNWTRQVVENILEAEKKWIELATQQSNLVIKALREGVELYRTAPNPTMADWAKQGLENFVETQRNWMTNNPFQQFRIPSALPTNNVSGDIQNAQDEVANQARGFAEQAQTQIDSLVDARKRWLDFVAEQNARNLQGAKERLNVPESSPLNTLADWTQQAVDNYVDLQKRWLSFATQWTNPNRNREE
jgi:hypothetical protein